MSKDKESLITQYIELNNEYKAKKDEILKKLKAIPHGLEVDDQLNGSCDVCFILSCPGEEELIDQKPAAGQTGKNLVAIMKELKNLDEERLFEELPDEIEKYNIINASNRVHFRSYNSAEDTDDYILHDGGNTKRVKASLNKLQKNQRLKIVIMSGTKATLLENLIKSKFREVTRLKIPHIGMVGLRNAYGSNYEIDGKRLKDYPEKARDIKRFELVARDLLKQMKEVKAKRNS